MRTPVQQCQRQITPHHHLLNLRTSRSIGTRQHKANIWTRLANNLRSIEKQPTKLTDFSTTTAGHQSDQRSIR